MNIYVWINVCLRILSFPCVILSIFNYIHVRTQLYVYRSLSYTTIYMYYPYTYICFFSIITFVFNTFWYVFVYFVYLKSVIYGIIFYQDMKLIAYLVLILLYKLISTIDVLTYCLNSFCIYAVLAGTYGYRFCNPHVVIFIK
jgi:hypothetical protein